jgi:heat shock protein HslJ
MISRLLVIGLLGSLMLNCSPSKKSGNKPVVTEIGNAQVTSDSINYNEEKYLVSQLINPKDLQGKWFVLTMRRTQVMPAEPLNGVTLSFADSSFAGKAPCNSIAGDFILNGANASFSNIIATKMACDKLEMENAFLKLLANSVKLMGVDGNKLMLKDKDGNTIFECIKDKS